MASKAPVLLGGLVLITNTLLCASMMRVFGLIWGGVPKAFTIRSPEVLWLMVLPTLFLMGLVLHIPQLLLQQYLHLHLSHHLSLDRWLWEKLWVLPLLLAER
jgi:NADH:ubiquinone oxidoreductase subunit 5 (subunit L)/multisubunit Na+/H+ antiporter MnhA subunit